ncbi:MAG: lysophospholipid acyltransferase family protein [Ignavibacteriales bacterium]|nr:lysophospholipid acyltransferase family protein [Ignavibacteriales bacterium]
MILTSLKICLIWIAAIPVSIIALISTPLDRTGVTFHLMSRLWCSFILWLFHIKIRTKGAELLDPKQRYVYISNHASAFDIPAVVVGIPDGIRFVLKKELTRIPIWGWALKYGHYITIDRGKARDAMKSLDEAAVHMRNGASVILFAEGTRTRDGRLQPFKRGAFTLAVKAGNPIVPVTINNTFRILPRGSLRVNPADIELVFGEPIQTTAIDGRDGEQRLMEQVRQAIAAAFTEQG